MFEQLNERSRDILRQIVDAYVETGEPVGSRTLSRRMGMSLSPATIRNVMADLTDAGLLFSPHTSAGRLPTEDGMRLFVDGLLEIGQLSEEERANIDSMCAAAGRSYGDALEQASSVLSGLSACAGLVVAPKADKPVKQIEFVQLGPGRLLVVLVSQDGQVENRVIEVPPGVSASDLNAAANYLTTRLNGATLDEMRKSMQEEMAAKQSQLDELSQKVVEAGLAAWSGGQTGQLIIKGQSNLLSDISAIEDLDRIRGLFEALEKQETILRLVDSTLDGDGVRIYIGAENTLFSHTGCSMIITPFKGGHDRIIGAIGVIGPTRLNYAKIIPMVDYTAKVISGMLT